MNKINILVSYCNCPDCVEEGGDKIVQFNFQTAAEALAFRDTFIRSVGVFNFENASLDAPNRSH